MLILAIRTDNPAAELYLYNDNQQRDKFTWEAHRQLAETLHKNIADLLSKNKKSWQDIKGIVVFKGPGSFTGLRIGLSVANALAASLHVPIVGSLHDDWLADGIDRLLNLEDESQVFPEYGAPVHITQQRK